MGEILLKTHLIVTDSWHEYHMDWCGKILEAKPKIENGKPMFIVVGSNGRMELNTTDMNRVEKCAKMVTQPKGRSSITTDKSRIYIKEIDDSEKLLGIMTHNYVRKFSPMYDKFNFLKNF